MVKKEVDSTTGCRFLSWHILDAKAVLGVYVITRKHIINYRYPLTCAPILEFQFTLKCGHVLERVVSQKWRGRLILNVKWSFNSMLSKIWDSSIFIQLIYIEVLQKTEPRAGFRNHNSCREHEHPFKHWVYMEDDLLWPWPGLKCVRMFPFWQAVRDGTAAWGEVSGSLFGGGDWADQTSTWKGI